MALPAKHRAAIATNLSPVIGEEETEALLAQFPSREDDDPITKDYVRAELNRVSGELRGTMKDQHAEHKDDIAEVRSEVKDLGTELRNEMKDLGTELRNEMKDLGTELRSEMKDLGTELRNEMKDLGAELRSEMKDLKAEVLDMMRRMTVWVASACIGSAVAASTIGTVVGNAVG